MNNQVFQNLRAIEQYAQYWYKETIDSNPSYLEPVKHPYRSVFACDRDRVMYSSAFRRLSSKTQVFNSRSTDNIRTRLTHTLEVSQIARTISSELGLDQELTEAIALGHDVGHTPFGHVGERTLNVFSIGKDKQQVKDDVGVDSNFYGFKHNLQSVRVLVEYSEGVKFSNFLLFGVREHSKICWHNLGDVSFYSNYNPYCSYCVDNNIYPAWSFEAYAVKWADEIAQRHHDIEDAFFQKILTPIEIVTKVSSLVGLINSDSITKKFEKLKEEAEKLERKEFTAVQYSFAHSLSSFLVDTYVTIIIKEFRRVMRHFSNTNKINNRNDFISKYTSFPIDDIRKMMSLNTSKIFEVDNTLGESLKNSILDSYEVQRADGKGAYVIRKLVRAYLTNPQQLPNEYINRFIKVELPRSLKLENETFIQNILKGFSNHYPENINIWKDYECRETLKAICSNSEWFATSYNALLRTILDYVAGMTDSYANKQYEELY